MKKVIFIVFIASIISIVASKPVMAGGGYTIAISGSDAIALVNGIASAFNGNGGQPQYYQPYPAYPAPVYYYPPPPPVYYAPPVYYGGYSGSGFVYTHYDNGHSGGHNNNHWRGGYCGSGGNNHWKGSYGGGGRH